MEIETNPKICRGIHCVDRMQVNDVNGIAAHIGIHHDSTFACAPAYTSPSERIVQTDTSSVAPILLHAYYSPKMVQRLPLSLDKHSYE